MTPDELARLRDLHEKASPAPWEHETIEDDIIFDSNEEEVAVNVAEAFIAHDFDLLIEARNALPGLLDHVDRLTQRAERAEARLARINRAYPEAYEQALAGDTQ